MVPALAEIHEPLGYRQCNRAIIGLNRQAAGGVVLAVASGQMVAVADVDYDLLLAWFEMVSI